MIPGGLQSGHPGSGALPMLQQAHSPRVSNSPHATPTNQDIEAVIQMATSGRGGPVPTRDTRTQLFVGNLPYRVRWQDLKDLFRKAGTVLRADVSLGPDNRSRGYGTVLLGSAEDAGRAIDMFNGYSWQTRILEVRPDRLPPEYDLNYPLPVAYGPPVVYPIITPQMQYPQSAFSMTNMMEELVASNLVTSNGTPGLVQPNLAASLVDPLRSSSRAGISALSASGSGRSLHVENLPFQCQWQDLKDLFRQIGPVARADVALAPDGRSRGFGTIVFQNDTDADKAVELLNGYEYGGRQLKVYHDRGFELGQGPDGSLLPSSPVLPHQLSSFMGVNPYSVHKPLIPSHIHQKQAAMFLFHSQPTSPFGEFAPSVQQSQFENPLKSSFIPGQEHQPPSSIGLRKPSSSQDLLVSALAGSAIARSESALSSSGASTSDSVFSKMEFPSLHHRPPSSNSGKPKPLVDSPSNNNNMANSPSSPERPTAQRNPSSNHPGSIAIPPPSGFMANGVMFSPRGLPPMTPSMPGFSFHPQVSTPPGIHPHYLSPGGPTSPHYYRHGSFHGMTMMSGMYGVPPTPPVPGQSSHPMLTPGPRLAGTSPMTGYPPQPMSPNHFPPHVWPGPGVEYAPHPMAMVTPMARSAGGAASPGEYFPLTMAAVEEPQDYFPAVADPSSAPNSEADTATSTTAADIDSPCGESSIHFSAADHPILSVPLVKALTDSSTVDIVNEIAVASGTARGKPAAKLWMSQKERIKKPVLGQSASEDPPTQLKMIDVTKSNSAPGLAALPSPGGRRASWGETSTRKPAVQADPDSR